MSASETSLTRGEDVLKRQSTKSEIVDILYRRVVAGEYAPGTWLRQEEIANELGVSPTPVREAFDHLVAEGLAEKIPYRGVRVPKFSEKEIADAFQLRFILEVKAASLAALNVTDEQAGVMREKLKNTKDLLRPEDMPLYRRLNRELHNLIVAASDNLMLVRVYKIALNHFPDWMLYEDLNSQPKILEKSLQREYEEHQALIEAIISRDRKKAAACASNHLQNVKNELVASLGVPEELMEEKEQAIGPL